MITINTRKLRLLALYLLLYFGYFKVLFFEEAEKLAAAQVVLLISTAFIAIYSLTKNKVIYINITIIFMLLFFAWIFISSLYSPSESNASYKISNVIVTILYCLLAYLLSFEIDLNVLLNYISKINFLLILVYIVINIANVISAILSSARIGNLIGDNPIWLCRFCNDTLLAMLCFDSLRNAKMKLRRIVQYVFLLFVIFFTGSKGPWVSLVICILMCLRLLPQNEKLRRNVRKIMPILSIIAIVVIVIGSNYIIPYLRARVLFTFSTSRGSRLNQYMYTFNRIIMNPILGYGLGSWPLYYWGIDIFLYPHNILLEMWFELGIMGLMLFLVYNFFIFKSVKMENIDYKMLFIFYISNLVYAMFSGSISEGNRGIYLFAVILAANCKRGHILDADIRSE